MASNPFPGFSSNVQPTKQMKRRKEKRPRIGGSPDDTSQECSGKVITSKGCKQSPRSWGGKN